MLLRLLCLLMLASPAVASAARDTAALCDVAAREAADLHGVPPDILLAITRVETGRGRGSDVRPWPWTLNQGGDGAWLDTATEAVTEAEAILARGTTNLDIGCFQLNHRWHGAEFASLEDMFDPQANAAYAAQFLAALYVEKGDWPAAIAAYHSRSDAQAARYLAKIETVLASFAETPDPEPAVVRVNAYPLLQAGGQGLRGSLVPLTTSRPPLIGATP